PGPPPAQGSRDIAPARASSAARGRSNPPARPSSLLPLRPSRIPRHPGRVVLRLAHGAPSPRRCGPVGPVPCSDGRKKAVRSTSPRPARGGALRVRRLEPAGHPPAHGAPRASGRGGGPWGGPPGRRFGGPPWHEPGRPGGELRKGERRKPLRAGDRQGMSGPGATCAATGGDALLDTLAISAKCAETVTNSSRAERLDWADVVLVDLAAWQSDRARRLRAQGAVHFEVQRRALEGGSAELAAEFRQRAKYLRKRGSLEAADRASHRAAAFERPAPPGTTATPPPFELWDRVIENEEGGTEVVRIPVSRWHAARARGLELWRARLQNCGQEFHSLRLDCGTCGHVRHLSLGAGVEGLCAVCRDRRGRQWRKEFERGRVLLEKVTAEQGLANGYRAIRGRFVTLTAPDVGALEERIALRALACRKFSRRLSRWTLEGIHAIATQRAGWFTEEQLRRLCHYVRVEEWTPGRDHHGHPHFHIWYHGPWLSADEVHDGWRADVLSTARERFPHLVAQLEKHE